MFVTKTEQQLGTNNLVLGRSKAKKPSIGCGSGSGGVGLGGAVAECELEREKGIRSDHERSRGREEARSERGR